MSSKDRNSISNKKKLYWEKIDKDILKRTRRTKVLHLTARMLLDKFSLHVFILNVETLLSINLYFCLYKEGKKLRIFQFLCFFPFPCKKQKKCSISFFCDLLSRFGKNENKNARGEVNSIKLD